MSSDPQGFHEGPDAGPDAEEAGEPRTEAPTGHEESAQEQGPDAEEAGEPRTEVPTGHEESEQGQGQEQEEAQPLARVRYGLAKELRLYPDSIVVELKEEHEETRYNLDSVKRIVLTPGEYNPAKLVLMFDLDDDTTVIVAEGMTNVRDFRVLLAKLQEVHPEIELEPTDMDTQLQQALEIRRRSLLGCYGGFAGICVALWIIYLVVAWVGHVH